MSVHLTSSKSLVGVAGVASEIQKKKKGRDMYVMVSYLMGILEVYLLSTEYVVLSSEFNTFQNLKNFSLNAPTFDNVHSLAISSTSNEGAAVLAWVPLADLCF